jgi:hypothetical protein
MKRDDIRAIFPDASDEDIDKLLGKHHAELNPLKSQLRDAADGLSTTQAELEGLKAKEADYLEQLGEAQKRIEAGMTAEELLAEKEARAAEREREFLLKSNGLDAKGIFVAAGIDADSIDALVAQVTVEDPDRTKASAQLIVDTIAKQAKAAEAAAKDALLKGNPKPQGSGGKAIATWDDFAKLPVAEQLAMKQANPNIVSELMSQR